MRPHALVLAALLLAGASVAAAYSCDAATCTTPACMCPATATPGGLTQAQTPMFVLISHDDSVNALQNRLVRTVTDGFKNPNGCNVPATWFALKDKTNCTLVQQLLKDNHEIAGHTMNHMRLSANLTAEVVTEEVKGVRDWLIEECGVPAEQLRGFRAPYLVHNEQFRTVLAASGYSYDSSIIEPFNSATSPSWAERMWPYTMDAGIPQDCAWAGGSESTCSATEKHAGLWEVPLWILPDESGANTHSMDIESADPTSADALFDLLVANFDAAYAGNRAPFPLFVHAPWFTWDNIEAATRFMEYTTTKQDVWFVTFSQLLDWIKSPVAASEVAASLTCASQVELTTPSVEYCRQYKTGPVEDTFSLAGKFGVAVDTEIAALNPEVNKWTIPEGTIMNIPPWDDRCDKPGAAFFPDNNWYKPVYTERVLVPAPATTTAATPAPAPAMAVAAPTAAPAVVAAAPTPAPIPAVAAPVASAPPAPLSSAVSAVVASTAFAALAGLAALALML